MLKGYSKAISDATGVTDQDVLFDIEGVMREVVFHSTLDWQSKAQFDSGALQALELLEDEKS